MVSVGEVVAVNVEVGTEDIVSVAEAAAVGGWVMVFVACRAVRLVTVGEAVAVGIQEIMEDAVALTEDTTCVMIRANARGAATIPREASDRLR
jgi:hypothetical protein